MRRIRGLWPVRQRQQAGRLERLADIRPLARAAVICIVSAADAAAQLSQLTSDNWVRPEFGLVPRTIWP
jgi:hypothetical protein